MNGTTAAADLVGAVGCDVLLSASSLYMLATRRSLLPAWAEVVCVCALLAVVAGEFFPRLLEE